jgi:hypothetical protein
MKRFLLLFSLLLLVAVTFAQVPNMRTNLRYNTTTCSYEVYVRPETSAPSFYMGGSSIIIAVPHNTILNYTGFRRNAFQITSVAPSGATWSITAFADKDFSAAYSATMDYYAVDNNGGAPLGAVTGNTEILLFSFKLGNNCIDGLRLWEGTIAVPNAFNDPRYPTQPYGGGGDYQTNISEGFTATEAWIGNYNNTPTVLPKPTVNISYLCDVPAAGFAQLTANIVGGSACNPASYNWSASTGAFFGVPSGASPYAMSPYGAYSVSIVDNNGCAATGTLTLNSNCTSSNPLPVEMIKFTVTKADRDALLDWATATEMNNDFFEVQHSVDGDNFTKLDRVYSKNGNSTTVQNYQYLHTSPAKGINYYRLKQVDFDGQFEYTDIRSVVFGNAGSLTIYPNPTNQILNVKVPVGMDENSVIEIVNGVGQVVRSISNNDVSKSILTLNVSDLSLGYYFIQIRTSTDQYREQFVITK